MYSHMFNLRYENIDCLTIKLICQNSGKIKIKMKNVNNAATAWIESHKKKLL